jgi:hypothetical protein
MADAQMLTTLRDILSNWGSKPKAISVDALRCDARLSAQMQFVGERLRLA